MKDINVTELKANLSKYLRLAARGTRIRVNDRDEPIAELGPLQRESGSWRARLIDTGRLRPGSQAFGQLRISRLGGQVDIQESLRDVREDPSEIRRR